LSNPIPHQIKVKVLLEWIAGTPRDKIAINNGIGRGTVTNILVNLKINTPDIDLMRQTALLIKKEGLGIFSLAASIRLRRLLEHLEINEDQIESLLEEIGIYCFKQEIHPKEFILKIKEVSDLAMDLKTPIHRLPSLVNQLSGQKNRLDKEISIKKVEYSRVVKEYEKIIEELKEFRSKKHLLPKLNDLQQMLDNKNKTLSLISKELGDFAKENNHLKTILAKDDILPNEITIANKKLALSGDNTPLNKKEISSIIYEIYHYPSDHINIIKTMRQYIKQRETEIND
jgi:hypothetical protein